MNFRNENMADSVVKRINGIAESIRNNTPLPQSRGAATVSLEEQPDGNLKVTKTFENGETELLTITGNAPQAALPEGFIDVTPQAIDEPTDGAVDPGGIIEGAAQGGNSLDSLLGQ